MEIFVFPYLDPDYLSTIYINITDVLPDNVDFVSASDGGSYNSTEHTVHWSFADPVSSKTVTVTVRESSGIAGSLLLNEAKFELGAILEPINNFGPVSHPEPSGFPFVEYFSIIYLTAEDETTVVNCQNGEIPEFPTVALPIAAILGIAFIFQRRKNE